MKKTRKNFVTWMAIFAMMFLVSGGMIACSDNSGGSPGGNEIVLDTGENFDNPDIDPDADMANVTVAFTVPGEPTGPECLPGTICQQSVIPGAVNPFELFGSLIGQIDLGDRSCYDPRTCAVDYSGSVVAGQFNATFAIPVGQTYHLAFKTNGKLAAHNITIGGTTMQFACMLGSGNYTWGVVSFIVNRDEFGAVTVTENPYCTAVPVVAALQVSGNSSLPQYDDPYAPYNGVTEGPMILQSSMADWAAPVTMATFVNPAWVEDFYMFTTPQVTAQVPTPIPNTAIFSIYYDATLPLRNIIPPVTPTEPNLGGNTLTIYNAARTVQLCAPTELQYWEDIDLTPTNYYGAIVNEISNATSCPVQNADNRFSIQ
jgi:hypothetical protein